ncbi:MAG: hypothetical protein AAFU77_17580 [Myxococcota bacterium]
MRIGIFLLATLFSVPAGAQSPQLFAAGSTRVNVAAGSGRFDGTNRVIFGAGLGYYAIDGLELALEGDVWLGGDVSLARASPSIRYVLWQLGDVTPYAGAFYRRWFVGEPFEDLDTIGVRVGAFAGRSGSSYLGLGVAYERQVAPACQSDCDYVYPELTAALAF